MIPWSYSFLRDLANCPQKAYRKYVKRDLPPEDSPELRDGITIHKILEDYINGHGSTRLPVELEGHAKPLVAQRAQAEVKLGMTKDMRGESFSASPWGRGKVDVLIVDSPNAIILDWKTGKVREDDRELKCLSMLLQANYRVNHVYGAYVWLKEGKMGEWRDLTDVNRTYHGTIAAMDDAERYEREGEWPINPNPLCGWCPVADCRFNSNPRLNKSVNIA